MKWLKGATILICIQFDVGDTQRGGVYLHYIPVALKCRISSEVQNCKTQSRILETSLQQHSKETSQAIMLQVHREIHILAIHTHTHTERERERSLFVIPSISQEAFPSPSMLESSNVNQNEWGVWGDQGVYGSDPGVMERLLISIPALPLEESLSLVFVHHCQAHHLKRWWKWWRDELLYVSCRCRDRMRKGGFRSSSRTIGL